jgi:hypothetical protein
MAKLGRNGKPAMNMSMIARMNTHRWNGLVLGLVIVVMAHLTAATNASRLDEPWPTLLTSEPARNPDVALLHLRAAGSLERLMQSAGAPGGPL